jgi:hypothetical protein
MLKDEPVKPKVITPNDIASLFGSSSSEASDDISYEDDDEDEVEESAPVNEVEIIKEEIIPQKKTVAEKRSYDSESVAMNELLALQKEYSTPPPSPIVPVSKSETFTEVVHTYYFHKLHIAISSSYFDYFPFPTSSIYICFYIYLSLFFNLYLSRSQNIEKKSQTILKMLMN